MRPSCCSRTKVTLLPLPKSGKKIALIGPFGNDTLNLAGPWAPFAKPDYDVNVEQGMRAALADKSLLTVTVGSMIEKPLDGGIECRRRRGTCS